MHYLYILSVVFIAVIASITYIIIEALFNYPTTKPYEFPIFQTRAKLNEDTKWKNYIESVYKDLPTDGANNFPLDISKFSVLYNSKLDGADIAINKASIYDDFCTLQGNTLTNYLSNQRGPMNDNKIWINKMPPFSCFSNNTFVEVFHADGDKVGYGAWMYAAEGTGNWFDVGNTICFKKHRDAIKFFLNKECLNPGQDLCDPDFPEMITAAKAQGYRSIQFTEHADQTCGLRASEIVYVDGNGFFPCIADPTDAGFNATVAANFKTGWNHTIDCVCDSTKRTLNCDLSTP